MQRGLPRGLPHEDAHALHHSRQVGGRQGIKYIRDLYANGLLDNESFTQSWDDLYVKTRTQSTPVVGAAPTFWKATHWEFNIPYFKKYKAIPQLTGPDGLQQTLRTYAPGFVGGLMITNRCANPELLLRWADTLYATEATLRVARGTPGMNWRWAEEGETGINEEQAIWAIIQQAPGVFEMPEPPTGPNSARCGSRWTSAMARPSWCHAMTRRSGSPDRAIPTPSGTVPRTAPLNWLRRVAGHLPTGLREQRLDHIARSHGSASRRRKRSDRDRLRLPRPLESPSPGSATGWRITHHPVASWAMVGTAPPGRIRWHCRNQG